MPTISDSGVVGAGSVAGVAVGNAAFSSLRSCTLLATAPGKPKPRPEIEPRIPDSIIRFQSSDVNLSLLFAIYFSAAILIDSWAPSVRPSSPAASGNIEIAFLARPGCIPDFSNSLSTNKALEGPVNFLSK